MANKKWPLMIVAALTLVGVGYGLSTVWPSLRSELDVVKAVDHDHHHHDEVAATDHPEEARTSFPPATAKAAGIEVETSAGATIEEALMLSGRTALDRNATAEVKARFPGIVRAVSVTLGQRVVKGETLALVEGNDSLQIYPIKAPISGTILARNTNVGDVAGESALFTISDLSKLWAEFHVFPRDLARVREGLAVEVATVDQSLSGTGVVSRLLPVTDSVSQAIVAVVTLANPGGDWRPGITVRGKLTVSERAVPVAVKTDALQRLDDQTVVFVTDGENYEARAVEIGVQDGAFVEVLSGLAAGERYVSAGSFIVKADIGRSSVTDEH